MPDKPGKIIDPDSELMKRVARGDDEAFRLLFERHHRLAYSVIYRHIGVQSAAEDLVQEAFLRVYRNAAKWEPSAKFSTWLYTVVSNLCLNYKRDKARDKLRLVGSDEDGGNPLEQLAATAETDIEALDAAERSRIIQAAISELPDNQRMALILSRYEDKSYEEVAEIMETTVAAVKSLTSRARETLREKLARFFDQ
ncbi:MAG: sigma-70 family RNA polymerase sigma factor [Planctomycetes bacterium]|nr:sigma-70 family RNA polymerase sigma factor [Planctomycetota bacterium]MCW8134212.1 sigma-70 family RNA polymerase sigma factor [Planctomycetota bacterium]